MVTATGSRTDLALAAVLAVTTGALLAAALTGIALPHAPLRVVVALLAAGVTTQVLRRAPILLICPLLWLGLASLIFYVLGPVVMMGLVSDPPAATDMIRPAIVPAVRAYQTGIGEVMVLQFSTLCLLGVAALSMVDGGRTGAQAPPGGRASRMVATGAAVIIVLGGALLILRARSPAVAAAMTAGMGREILHGLPPLLAVAVAALFHLAARRRLHLLVAMGAAIAVATVLLSTISAAKSAVFIGVSGIGLYMATARLAATRIVAIAGAGVLLLLGCVIVLGVFRHSGPPADFVRDFVVRSVAYKLLARQSETAGCLQTVFARELPDGRGDSPVYFAAAVVPRVLWPEKPNLSLGAEYGFRYCAVEKKDVSPDSPQSYSITLLGQPVARAGWAGLLVAELTVLLGLGAVTFLAWRTLPPGPVALAALLPWLIDFDQSFALYVANAAKMALWMSPAVIALALLAHREKKRP